ncbi:KAP family P-loop NTPase fold protein [Sphingobacterium pedocola]|uniref:AAA+ ATPase domain-containing protein n=1 Tax=Sphingobacterium pedocola TaxID=2082722 RepID=A0ABR9TCB3_9SPHI|nr:P-loop NTPase fold protein [Sphingobacterium pedocola]MBE8722704.1 hypothetical protein [Sphingobacterium pedocola]
MNNKKHNNLGFIYFLLLLGLLIVFREPLANLIDTMLVKPIFSKVSSSLATDLAILSSLTIMICLLWDNKDHKWIIKCLGTLLILFAIYRFGNYWSYTLSYLLGNTHLAYIDLTAIFVSILFGRHWYLLCARQHDQGENTAANSGFIEDNSIETEEHDTYERSQIAKQIANQILGTKNTRSFAIGITGVYGSGKTSFINLITNALEKETHPPLIINFNPWNAETTADLQKLFFDELSISLGKEDSALSSHLYNYYRRLNGKSTFVGNLVNNLRDVSVIFNRDLDDEKKKINDMMIALSRKIIIVIDDLDRLHNEEVIEVLRLIRNTANFGNITYIVAYDKRYVEESLKKLNKRSYKNYLDKIFQIEIPLPKAESYLIANALIKHLEQIVRPNELSYVRDQFINLNFDSEYEEAISAAFNSHRDIVRFVNSFSIAYEMISEEVDFVQLLYIQILKFRYPIAYDTLYDRRKEVLINSSSTFIYNQTYSLRKISENRDAEYTILDILKDDLNLYDLTQVKYILNHLFALNLTLHDKYKTRTITNPAVFELFFTSRISSVGLSERGFVKHMLGDVTLINPYIDNQLEKGFSTQLTHRILKMNIQDFIDRDHYENIAYAFIQKIIPAYINEKGMQESIVSGFISTHLDQWEQIVNKYYDRSIDAHSRHVSKLLSFHEEAYLFISELARKMILRKEDMRQEDRNIISIEFFLDKQLKSLTAGVDSNSQIISPEVTWMFWGIRRYYRNDNEDQSKENFDDTWEIHPKAVKILYDKLNERDLKHLLQSLISRDMYNEDRYVLHAKLIKDTFRNILELRRIVNINDHTAQEIKKEFLGFLWQYEQNSGSSVKSTFEHLEIN